MQRLYRSFVSQTRPIRPAVGPLFTGPLALAGRLVSQLRHRPGQLLKVPLAPYTPLAPPSARQLPEPDMGNSPHEYVRPSRQPSRFPALGPLTLSPGPAFELF